MPRQLQQPFACAVEGCDFSTDVQAILMVHVRRTHTGVKATCPVCAFTSWDSDVFRAHKRTHRGEAVYPCTVPGCGYRAWSLGGLRGHVRAHSGEAMYACIEPGCGFQAWSSHGLGSHMRTHSPGGGKHYQCQVAGCDFITAAYSQLQGHASVHSVKKHFCDMPGCPFGTRELSALTAHTRLHKGKGRHVCAVPGCSFSGAIDTQLWRHMRVHTVAEMSQLYAAGRRR